MSSKNDMKKMLTANVAPTGLRSHLGGFFSGTEVIRWGIWLAGGWAYDSDPGNASAICRATENGVGPAQSKNEMEAPEKYLGAWLDLLLSSHERVNADMTVEGWACNHGRISLAPRNVETPLIARMQFANNLSNPGKAEHLSIDQTAQIN